VTNQNPYEAYAGRWVTLDEVGEVVSAAERPDEARRSGRKAFPKERLQLAWIPRNPPYLPLPEWPFRPLRAQLRDERLWLAGGAVRDLLLKRPLHDWDYAVEGRATALARRVADAFGGAYVTLDAERDTARVIVRDPETGRLIDLDFAGLRGTSILEDLRARDFTINAMALDEEGQLLDPTGGQEDLAKGMVRATGPSTFTRDPARLLRAVRTAVELGFEIDAATLADLRRHRRMITRVAGERVRAELRRIVEAVPAAPGLRLAQELGLLAFVLPEVAALVEVGQSRPHHYPQVFDHTLAALAAYEGLIATLEGRPLPHHVRRDVGAPTARWAELRETLAPFQARLLDYVAEELAVGMPRRALVKWGILLHDVGKAPTRTVGSDRRTRFYGHPQQGAEMVTERLTALRFPNRARQFVERLVAHHMRILDLTRDPPPSRRATYRFFRDTKEAGVGVLLLALADTLAVWGPRLDEGRWDDVLSGVETLWAAYFEEQGRVVAPPPLLNGRDLIAMGIPQGPVIGRLLDELREAQATGEVATEEEARAFVRRQREG
jgi:putative nucleotidyltransferase with HDIG domain